MFVCLTKLTRQYSTGTVLGGSSQSAAACPDRSTLHTFLEGYETTISTGKSYLQYYCTMNNTTTNNDRTMGDASTSTSSVIDYFSQSTQSMYWIFDDEETLMSCRQEALNESAATNTTTTSSQPPSSSLPRHKRARKFASGYQRRWNMQQQQKQEGQSSKTSSSSPPSSPSLITPSDQETIVHFHAHQLQQLVGPNAMFEQLRRSSQVLSTAIVLLRRFYLSNSVVDFHPRHIAAAAALLAVKADCEPNLPVSSMLCLF